MPERWAPIPGYEGHYEVSDQGRVRSLTRNVPVLNGPHTGAVIRRPGKMMSPVTNPIGHRQIQLMMHKRRVTHSVHRLMLLAFLGGGEGLEACHINGIPDDNRLENLYWGTRSQNMQDMVRHGRHWGQKLTHCTSNHPFTPDNLYVNAKGHRRCRECAQKAARERNRRRAERNGTAKPHLRSAL